MAVMFTAIVTHANDLQRDTGGYSYESCTGDTGDIVAVNCYGGCTPGGICILMHNVGIVLETIEISLSADFISVEICGQTVKSMYALNYGNRPRDSLQTNKIRAAANEASIKAMKKMSSYRIQ